MDLDANSDSTTMAGGSSGASVATSVSAPGQSGGTITFASTTLRSAGLIGAEGLVDAIFHDEQAPHMSVMVS